jgi:hypothetical protein
MVAVALLSVVCLVDDLKQSMNLVVDELRMIAMGDDAIFI